MLKMSEEQHHLALVEYANYHWWRNLFFHIPNEQKLLSVAARSDKKLPFKILNKMKKMGVKKWMPDFFLMLPKGEFHGLWLEIKSPTVKKLPVAQKDFLEAAKAQGYYANWSNDLNKSIHCLNAYLGL